MSRPATSFLALLCSLMMTLGASVQGAPEIVLEYPEGTELADGSGVVSWGKVTLGVTTSLQLVIKNTGNAPLTNVYATFDGADVDDFGGTGILPSLPPGQKSSLTFRFTPSAEGVRTANMRLHSNDVDESPLDLQVSGTGVVQQFSIEAPSGTVIPSGGTYDFGTPVLVGDQLTHQLAFRNTGEAALIVPYFDTTQTDEFGADTVPSPHTLLAPGATIPLYVIFQPKLGGLRTATLQFRDQETSQVINQDHEINITGTGLQAVMKWELPAGTPVNSPEGIFGTLGVGASKSLVITITNIGTATMNISQVELTGMQAGDFTQMTPPASTLAVSESTTMTVRFSPQALGLRRTFMVIHSDAVFDVSPEPRPTNQFAFLINGTCALSSISLNAATYEAAAKDKQSVVTLTRSPADVAATVRLDAHDGTAEGLPLYSPAQAGVDYTDLTGATSLVSFAAGEAQKTVNLPLLAPTSRAGLNRQMTLTLSEPSAAAELGAITTATLRIMAVDTTKPTVTITTPAAAGKVRAAADQITVTGKVGDAKGISRVEMTLNGGEPVPVSLEAWTSPTAIPFSFVITPVNGPNEIIVTAWDPRGNSTSLKRAFTFLRLRTLTVRVFDSSNPEPTVFTTFKLAATPSGSAQPLRTAVPPEPGMADYTALIAPGAQVALTAIAPKGYVFSNWDYGDSTPEFTSQLGNQVTFTMPDNDANVLAAQVQHEHSALPAKTVSLHCLLDAAYTPVIPALKGYLTGTLSPTGTFTGKFQILGKSQTVNAVCYHSGPAAFTVAGKKTDALPVPGGKLRLAIGSATYTREDGAESSGSTQQAPFSTANKVPSTLLNSTTQGFYTVRLDPMSAQMSQSAYPRGHGYATAKLTATGQVSITGALPDGSAITCSSALLDDGTAPVYLPLLTPGSTAKGGLLFGKLQFTENGTTPYITASLQWFRPAAASPKVLLYSAGWPTGITLDTYGFIYDNKQTVQAMLELDAPGSGVGNASLSFIGGNLTEPLAKENFNIVKNAVVKIAPADGSYTLTFTPSTGLFSGTFMTNGSNAGSAKLTFKGVILQNTGLRGGHGFFLNNAKDAPAPESGVVILGGPLP